MVVMVAEVVGMVIEGEGVEVHEGVVMAIPGEEGEDSETKRLLTIVLGPLQAMAHKIAKMTKAVLGHKVLAAVLVVVGGLTLMSILVMARHLQPILIQ